MEAMHRNFRNATKKMTQTKKHCQLYRSLKKNTDQTASKKLTCLQKKHLFTCFS